jgi:hypothetical protein
MFKSVHRDSTTLRLKSSNVLLNIMLEPINLSVVHCLMAQYPFFMHAPCMTHLPYCYQFATCWRKPRTLIDCFSCLLSCDILLGYKASHNANSGVKKHSCFFYDDHHHASIAIVTEVGENGHTPLELGANCW